MSDRRDCYYWRVAATGLSFALFGLGGIILGYTLLPAVALLSRSQAVAVRRCRWLIHQSFRLFVGFMRWIGVLTYDLQGEDILEREGQLIIANHPTLIDVVFLISRVPNASCIVKSQLYENVFTRGPVRLANYIPNNSPHQLVEECSAQIAAGASLVVFPEGGRSAGILPSRFKRGAAYLWLRARCPVSLVTISSIPPTLAKHEKWYQVPAVRPHFRLVAKDETVAAGPDGEDYTPSTARSLTRQWQDHFSKEIMI